MAEALRYGREYDQYDSLIKEANRLPKDEAKEVLRKIQLELFKKYSLDDEKVKQLIKKFEYSV